MSPRKPLDLFAVSVMVALCLGWGFQQIAVKLIAADIAPVMQMALRSAMAALVLGAVIAFATTVAIASLSYEFFEKPFIRFKARFEIVPSRSA